MKSKILLNTIGLCILVTFPHLVLGVKGRSSLKGGGGGSSRSGISQQTSRSSSYVAEEPFQRQSAAQSYEMPTHSCERPKTPDDAHLICQMPSSEKYTCTASCRPGFQFPDGSESLTLECSRWNGLWAPYRNFPECSPSSEHLQGHYAEQRVSGYSCRRPPNPSNAQVFCREDSYQSQCQATCNPGYQFPDGTQQVLLSCTTHDGRWTPHPSFEDCELHCHPPCEHGGQCTSHNQCICSSSFRGNRCQYPTSNCDFATLRPNMALYNCTHRPEYTECHVACSPGTTFDPPTTSIYRCTVDGRWNPPTLPNCVRNALCDRPPSPMNGRIQCTGNAEIMICSAYCNSGFLFPEGFSELVSQCSHRTGQWLPDSNFPDCIPTCHPSCANGGVCVGHNQCLCPPHFRGARCQYPLSNCDVHTFLSEVAWECQHHPEETSCHVGCVQGGQTLQPSYPTEYTCSPDGVWNPPQRPRCLQDYENGNEMSDPHHQDFDFYDPFQEEEEAREREAVRGHLNREAEKDPDSRFEQQSRDYGFGQEPVDYDFGDESRGRALAQEPYDVTFQKHTDEDEEEEDDDERIVHEEFQREKHRYDLREDYKSFQQQRDEAGFGEEDDEGIPEEKYHITEEDEEEILENADDWEEVTEMEKAGLSAKLEVSSTYRGVCSSWGYHHYRTFDGGIYTFPGTCDYILASDCGRGEVSIGIRHHCEPHEPPCVRGAEIHIPDGRYLLSPGGLTRDGRLLPIPTHVEGLTVEKIARYLVAKTTTGFVVWVDDENGIHVTASPALRGRMCGLCGDFDDNPENDVMSPEGDPLGNIFTFGNSWRVLGSEACADAAEPQLPCRSDTHEQRQASDRASLTCSAILSMEYAECPHLVDTELYYRMCQMDCCSVHSEAGCECSTLSEYFRECSLAGGDLSAGWRRPALCAMSCANGTEYQECGSPCPATCSNQEPTCRHEHCVDGCHCPPGTLLEEGNCVSQDLCPCHYGRKKFASGQTMQQDCNSCSCQGGNWQCTNQVCPSTCTMTGPHFTTFDGVTYDLDAHCSHYLVDGDNFSIEVEIAACREPVSSLATCIKSIIIDIRDGATIKMKPGMEVTVNGQEMNSLPVSAPGAYVSQATSIYMKAQLASGLEVLWDGAATVHVNAPPTLFHELRGLCGTYSRNQMDDFLTPEGDVEQTVSVFAAKWKVEGACPEETEQVDAVHESPCDRHPLRREEAEDLCAVLKGEEFRECHDVVDYDPYYSSCLDDVCACPAQSAHCLCAALSSYGSACARKGRPLQWRREVPPCGIHCDRGLVYQVCANPCHFSCSQIATQPTCQANCVEGCTCPPGFALDHGEKCVPVSSCSCVHSGHVYPPEFLQRRGREMCECSDGEWACRAASASDILLTPPPHVAVQCSSAAHQEFTDCVSDCPLTCLNMHHHQPCTVAVCVAGCRCQEGYVMDPQSEVCVLPQECPCHHGGQSYEEGAEVKMDCNNCMCEAGQWQCDSNPCPGICQAWGESHYKTFDGRMYDFQGECDYVLLKGRVDQELVFSVVIQNVPCGTRGITCSKAVIIALGESSISLSKGDPAPPLPADSRLSVSQLGMFTLVHSDVGISVQWDRDTRVYVIAEPIWKGKLQGLCGDFNLDSSDDFLPPSRGLPMVRAEDFADSWRVHDYCRPSVHVEDSCELHPERRDWARSKCAVLKSQLFSPCRGQVQLEPYYKRCVFDACSCDAGGDCQCLCAAVAAYAQECARHEVPIAWRSQQLCPIQCEECDRYAPCITLCPPRTCASIPDSPESHSCNYEPCVEGCARKPCPAGHVYRDLANMTCIPEEECEEKPCVVINGVSYREGERIADPGVGDACQSCYCRQGAPDCVGVPCTSAPSLVPLVQIEECEMTGWTEWLNSVDPKDQDGDDWETLDDLVSTHRLPCPKENISTVQCRVASTEAPAEITGQLITCDPENGMTCNHRDQPSQNNCEDFEMRIYCECEKVTCPTGQSFDDCAFSCDSVCQSVLQELRSEGSCKDHEANCVPGCVTTRCRHPLLSRDKDTCVVSEDCTCRLDTGYLLAPGEVVTSGCEKCQCLNNSLICSTLHECSLTSTEAPALLITTQMTTLPLVMPCEQGWTPWVNSHEPDVEGEEETLDGVRSHVVGFCTGGNVTAIECRERTSEKPYELMGQTDVRCDLQSGLVCFNDRQVKARKCLNYEIRLHCDCKGMAAATTTTAAAPTAVGKAKKMRAKKKKRPEEEWVAPCSYWSEWQNNDRPRKGQRGGDTEDTLPFILQQTEGFCLEGKVTEIECREAKTEKNFAHTDDVNLVCTLEKGFVCRNSDQPSGLCSNYKIRYFCSCEGTVFPTTLILKSTTPGYIYPCNEFALLLDGPSPLPDSQLRASSSLSPASGPHSARLSSNSAANSAGAWTAEVADDRQFIEVDLRQTRGVYGIVTSGREGFGEWVSSYRLLHSLDGVIYSYYLDEDESHKIFPANFDSTSEVQQILEQPFEARFVRLEPVTWEGHISLRFDVLGCAEALATSTAAPSTYAKRVQATMPEAEVCKDPMGLENGLLSDSQLSASSSYDDESLSPEHGRLGSNSAWAVADLDDEQYFQVDFLEPRHVTSVITRGRPGVPQWVSAYIVAYSNDAKVWNKVHNHVGQIQEFAANYDEDTPVTNQLPATLRTRYLRIQPTKWKNWISLQAEVLGCFHPYQCRDPMGLENGLVANAQLTASSVYDLSVASANGRLGTTTAWAAATLDKNQYLQIDFLERFNLTGVVTKGRKNVPQWVTAFEVAHSEDGIHWNKMENEFGVVMEFPGNTDQDSAVTNLFPEAVNTRFLRILPTKWKNWISLRVEVLGCYHPQVCKEPMGLENGLLADVQLSASSAYDDSLIPENARLGDETAWAAAILDDKQYLQIDFLAPRNITGVVTKGRQDSPQWVKAFKLRVSDDADTWTPIVNDVGDEIEFPANKDQQSAVTNLLPEEVITRYLRIIPTEWEGWISLQVEVLGCYHPEVCQEPMGLQNGLISDVQLSASSSYDSNLTPDDARLGSDTAWASEKLDDRQYLQIDFLEPRNLTAVVTRGRNDAAQWVTAYRVSYSDDGESFTPMRNEQGQIQEYRGNSDIDSSVVNVFPEVLTTRYLRIHPIRWKSWISLRADVLGCFHPYTCKDPMGLKNGLLSDSQISASSFLDEVSTPSDARLNSDTAWAAAELDEDQYLEIDFLEPRNLSAIITKGRHNDDEWVTSYQVAYSDDGENWQVVTDDVGKAKEFPGNSDRDSPVTNLLPETIEVQYLRIIPTEYEKWISLRAEVLGCYHPYPELTSLPTEVVLPSTVPASTPSPLVCSDPMGLENGLLPDSQISASSFLDEDSTPSDARLNSDTAWAAAELDEDQYLEIDFLEPRNLSAIITKGRHNDDEWVTSYQVAYSDDGENWQVVTDDVGKAKEFPGNSDRDSPVTNLLPETIEAQYLRIIPTDYNNWISLRAEVLGCYHPYPPITHILPAAALPRPRPSGRMLPPPPKGGRPPPEYQPSTLPEERVLALTPPVTTPPFLVCSDPMGLENGLLPDSQISASSFLDEVSTPSDARLNSDTAWAAAELDEDQYLEIDFLEPRNLSAIITKGRHNDDEWVTSYQVAYSDDGENWQVVTDDVGKAKEFPGNSDRDSPITNLLPETIEAQYLRIIPTDYNNWISLRAEVLGCYHPYPPITVILPAAGLPRPRPSGRMLPPPPKGGRPPPEYQPSTLPEERVLALTPPVTTPPFLVCSDPMGLENGLLPDSQISASSFLDEVSTPSDARLNSDTAWAAAELDEDQYLEIDFLEPRNLSAIITKGRHNDDEWVTSYQVAYSDDGENWQVVTDDVGKAKEFPGNSDRDSPVANLLPETIEAQYLRIIPTDYNNWISLRAEVLGCYHPYPPITHILPAAGLPRPRPSGRMLPPPPKGGRPPPEYQPSTLPEERVLALTPPVTTPPFLVCSDPMGLENGLLPDSQISASSFLDEVSTPSDARLNSDTAWAAAELDEDQYLEIDFLEPRNLSAIITKGRHNDDEWVTSYQVAYSDDGENWQVVTDDVGKAKEFPGNSDRDSPVANLLPETIEAQYLRIIPTDYNNWISLRAEVLGCYHPYRPSTVPPAPALLLCPEMDPKLVTSCPSSCPPGLLCDGKRCVDPVDCVCVHNGIIYQVSDQIADATCTHCDCALGGHSICSPKTCPPCPQDTKQKILRNCSCSCEPCDEGRRICPTSKECVPEELWCDGVIDCPDDEINCLATTTTTVAVPVTPVPVENATCDIVGRHITTLDGQEIVYEPCHHIVLQDIADDSFSVQVHKECADDGNSECRSWVEVRQDDHTVQITSDLDVRYDGHSYTASQLVLLSHNSAANFTVQRIGKQIVFKSITKRFTVLYDINARLKVDVSLELLNKVAGLCGFYSNKASDDQQKPDGQQAYTSQEFGNSWATGEEAECVPTLCPHQVMIQAVESCAQLRESPFSACEDVIDVSNYIESCMSSMCECLQRDPASSPKECHCNSFLPLVEACEKPLGSKLRNWRVKFGCPPQCPPGMEWNDCGPSCQLTCDTPPDVIDQCSGDCMAGCFCPAGTVQNGDRCIPPQHCSDRVCQGYGDPHLETFDGLFFPFQSVGTFLIAADDAINFMIEGVTEQCNDLATITCVIGLMISYKEHKIVIARGRELIADERQVPMDDLPLYLDDVIVMAFPGRSFIVMIPPLNIEARYYEENAGFAVKIPSRRYFNKTIGICGNCNAKKNDEIPNDSVSEFVCSWLTDGNEENCKTSFTELPEVKGPAKICENLNDAMFVSCHPLIDPSKYIDACSYDTAHSEDEEAALCKTLMEYARQCCRAGEYIDRWIRKFGCNVTCPNNLEYSQCHDACPQTCEARNSSRSVDCRQIKTDGCFCPEGKVLKDGACVDDIFCETCDLEGHVPGDTWKKRPCETCHCKPDLNTECRLEVCPQPPLCGSGQILTKHETTDQSCCESYSCVLAPFECPLFDVPRCPKGQVAKVRTSETTCPEFECVCDVILCPPVRWPQDLEEGQRAELVNASCCPHVEVQCHVELCPEEPTCGPALELVKTATGCCTQYKCKPPRDVCVYVHNFAVVEGLEAAVDISQAEPKIYKPGDVWQDGLCENCSCTESQGQFLPLCVVEQCPALQKHPDNKDYELLEFNNPGQCCPDVYRMQCKDEEGNLYEAEDEWQSKDNPCVVFVCEPTVIGDVQKVKKVIDCPKCQEPSEYIPPSTKLGQCCGICQPAKCQEKDHLFDIGETWTPSANPCQTAECVKENGTVKTVYTNPSCPLIPDDCPQEKIVRDEKGCCQSCSLESEIKCSTVPIPPEETIGFFTYSDPSHGGECINEEPVPDVLQCSGACHSQSYYSLEEVDFKSVCMCCKVNITINRTVEMNCPDGARVTKSFLQPANCQCSKCSGGSGRQRYDLTQQRETETLGRFQQQEEGDNFKFGQEEEGDNFKFGQEEEEDNFKFGKESFGRFQQEEEEEDRLQYGQQREQKLYDNLQQNQESLNAFQQEEEELKK